MITVKQVDGLVVSDDAVAARLWPRLGPKVQRAYLNDRDRWVGLRRRVEAGETLPQTTLASEHRVFTGWARAFRAAAGAKRRPAAKKQAPARAGRLAATAAAAAAAAPATPPATVTAPGPGPSAAIAAPSLAAVTKSSGGAGAAAAGGLLALAGLVAFAARRKRP
jgi:MYXO-CTERM domain-containing protein